MKLKFYAWVTVGHGLDIGIGVVGIENAERVRQEITQDRLVTETVNHLPDVIAAVAHALRPILQIKVDVHSFGMGIVDDLSHVGDMLFGRFLQLVSAMAQGAFGKDVDGAAAAFVNPIDRLVAIDEAQHLNAVEHAMLSGILANHAHCAFLAFRHAGRRDLYAVNAHLCKQIARYHQLLVGQEAHSVGLLTVAERGVHYFYFTCAASHAFTLSLF